MSRTIRKAYTGALVRDGQWTRRCPEPHCDWCVRGRAKRAWNRKQRRDARGLVRGRPGYNEWGCDEDESCVVRPVLYSSIQELVKSNVIR